MSLGMNAPAAIVLNTHYSGLGIARNLAPFGVRVIGLTAQQDFFGNRSRYLEYHASPDSLDNPAELLNALIDLARSIHHEASDPTHRPVLFPTRDHDVEFINAHREQLSAHFTVPFAPAATIERVMNKASCADAAAACGIRVPCGLVARSLDELEACRALRFPCVCKPLFSSQWRKPAIRARLQARKAVKLASFDALKTFYQSFSDLDPVVSVQEWVEGPESSLRIFGCYVGQDHQVKAFFTAHKLLQQPPLMGTGIVVEAAVHPDLEQPSRALLSALRFSGVAEIEYKIDSRDGSLNLIEINPRHWDQHRLGTAVGVNLSWVAYLDCIGRPIPRMQQVAQTMRWVAEPDIAFHALSALTAPLSLWRIIRTLKGPRVWAVGDAQDPAPARAMWRSFATELFAKIKNRLRFGIG